VAVARAVAPATALVFVASGETSVAIDDVAGGDLTGGDASADVVANGVDPPAAPPSGGVAVEDGGVVADTSSVATPLGAGEASLVRVAAGAAVDVTATLEIGGVELASPLDASALTVAAMAKTATQA
jgi:hypothetical protein